MGKIIRFLYALIFPVVKEVLVLVKVDSSQSLNASLVEIVNPSELVAAFCWARYSAYCSWTTFPDGGGGGGDGSRRPGVFDIILSGWMWRLAS